MPGTQMTSMVIAVLVTGISCFLVIKIRVEVQD